MEEKDMNLPCVGDMRTASGVQKGGGRSPQAARLVGGPHQNGRKAVSGPGRGGPHAEPNGVGYGRSRLNYRESMATPCLTPMVLEDVQIRMGVWVYGKGWPCRKVSSGPAMPNLSTSCGQDTSEMAL
jgi:hypothetical protein